MAKPDPTDKSIDDLIAGKKPEEILGEDGVLKVLTKRLVERALEGEMTYHVVSENSIALQRNHLPNVFLSKNPSPSLAAANLSSGLAALSVNTRAPISPI